MVLGCYNIIVVQPGFISFCGTTDDSKLNISLCCNLTSTVCLLQMDMVYISMENSRFCLLQIRLEISSGLLLKKIPGFVATNRKVKCHVWCKCQPWTYLWFAETLTIYPGDWAAVIQVRLEISNLILHPIC